MTKILAVLCWIFFSVTASATVTRFDCQTTQLVDKGIVSFSFFLTENRGAVAVVENEGGVAVRVYPLLSQINELNDEPQAVFTTEGQGQDLIRVWNTGNSCSSIILDLYRTSNFRVGYVQMEGTDGCGTSTYISTVSCKVTPLNATGGAAMSKLD